MSKTAGQFWPIILILRIYGRCPISCAGNSSQYSVKIKSFTFIYSVISGLILCLSWIYYLLCLSFKLDMPFKIMRTLVKGASIKEGNESTVLEYNLDSRWNEYEFSGKFISVAFMISQITLPVSVLVDIFSDWITFNHLKNWLNNWNLIESEFNRVFSKAELKFQIPNTCFSYWFVFFYAVVPTIGFLICITFNNLEFYFLEDCPLIVFLDLIFYSSFTILTNVEDVKVMLMYRSLKQVFRQVREGIKSTTGISSTKVREWTHLINSIRKQVILTGKYQTVQQLITVLLIGISISLTLFFLLTMVVGSGMFTSAVIFCIVSSGRLFWKAALAEEITYEEDKIADELLEIHDIENEPATLAELKFLFNLIQTRPSEINLGNLLVLNKRLLFSVGTQVFTYLIIIIQFNNCN